MWCWYRDTAAVHSSVGPATQEVDMLEKMMQAGMSVIRMNFSHGSYEVSLNTFTLMMMTD